MPILPKKIENKLPICTNVLINDIALIITRCTFQEYNTVQDGEEVLTNTKRAIKAINPDLDVDIYDETNNSVEAVIHNIMYDVIGYCAKNTC